MIRKPYQHITVGGTFDHLHDGHKALIAHAFKISDLVSIAITSNNFPYKKLLSEQIEPLLSRRTALENFLTEKKLIQRAKIIPIDTMYGFSLEDYSLQAILVTKETYSNALEINKKRKKKHMEKLDIVTFPFVKGTDKKIIRSARIRSGEINRSGFSYSSLFRKKKQFRLPNALREQMRLPLGTVCKNEVEAIEHLKKIKPTMVITVGDVVTSTLQKKGLTPDISIIDFMTRRQKLKQFSSSQKSYNNAAGTIQKKAALGFNRNIRRYIESHKKNSVFINGEEDLLALPAILFAPLGACVLYGQFSLGIVVTEVNEDKKKIVEKILEKFK